MQQLPTRQGLAGHDEGERVLPIVRPLWGTIHTTAGEAANSSLGVFRAPQQSAGRLVDVRPFGKRNPGFGGRPNCDWPGKTHGVRAPHPEETPLSWSEVHHALAQEIL